MWLNFFKYFIKQVSKKYLSITTTSSLVPEICNYFLHYIILLYNFLLTFSWDPPNKYLAIGTTPILVSFEIKDCFCSHRSPLQIILVSYVISEIWPFLYLLPSALRSVIPNIFFKLFHEMRQTSTYPSEQLPASYHMLYLKYAHFSTYFPCHSVLSYQKKVKLFHEMHQTSIYTSEQLPASYHIKWIVTLI